MGSRNPRPDQSLFIMDTKPSMMFVLVFIDNIIFTGSCNLEIHELIVFLNKEFSLKYLGHQIYFLGIDVKELSHGFARRGKRN